MPSPSVQQLLHDPMLTELAVGYMQDSKGFIANEIAPIVPVKSRTGKFRKFSKADFFRADMQLRAPGSPAVVGGFGVSSDTFSVNTYAIAKSLSDEERAEFDYAGAVGDQSCVAYIAQQAMIRREILVLSSIFAGSVWSAQADQTGVGSGPSTNEFLQFAAAGGAEVASSNPLVVLGAAVEAVALSIGRRPNRIAMSLPVALAISRHSVCRGYVSDSKSVRDMDMAELEKYLKIEPGSVVVGSAVYNTAAEGLTASQAYILGKSIWVGFVDKTAGLLKPTAVKQLSFSEFDDVQSATELGAPGILKWRDPNESAKTDWFSGEIATVAKVTAADAGCYLASVIG